jgi:hypothetical protein
VKGEFLRKGAVLVTQTEWNSISDTDRMEQEMCSPSAVVAHLFRTEDHSDGAEFSLGRKN